MNCCELSIREGTYSYGNDGRVIVLRQFTGTFTAGRVVVLMGPNGCGKSTLLRVLVGELPLDTGDVLFKCPSGSHTRTDEYLPQDYRQALFPWKTFLANVRPWRTRELRSPRRCASKGADELLELLGIGHLRDRFPYEASGGQQQIGLLARCIASDARIVILDEPFSALDVIRRSHLASRLRQAWVDSARIVVCAMHEPDEAVTLADEVLMFGGPPLTEVGRIARETYVDAEGQLKIDEFRRGIAELLASVSDAGGKYGA